MSKLKIITTDIARVDIKNIVEYIAENNKKAGLAVGKLLKKTFTMLAEYPHSGSKKEIFNLNDVYFYTTKKRFTIVYKITNNSIVFLRVLTRYQDIFTIL